MSYKLILINIIKHLGEDNTDSVDELPSLGIASSDVDTYSNDNIRGDVLIDNVESVQPPCLNAESTPPAVCSLGPIFSNIRSTIRTQSMQTRQRLKKLFDNLMNELTVYCNELPVFGFNSSRYDINIIKEYLIPYVTNTKEEEIKVIKKANQFVTLKIGNVVFMDILNFLGGCTSLDGFLKAYRTSETKGYFPYEWLESYDQLLNTKHLPPIESFYSRLRCVNVLAEDYFQMEKLTSHGKSVEEAMLILKLQKAPLTAEENYRYLQTIWLEEKMQSMLDFLRWYNNKDVVPTREAMERMLNFYHSRDVDLMKVGYTLPSIANRMLHKSTSLKFHPFAQKDEDLAIKIRSNVVGGPSIVFTRYAKACETIIRHNGSETCKTIVGVDASQLYPYSMTQKMPTGPYTRWDLTDDGQFFTHERDWRSQLEKQVLHYMNTLNPQCTIQCLFRNGKQKRIGPYLVDGYCAHCQTVYEVMGCYYHACDCQMDRIVSSGDEEKMEWAAYRRQFDEEKRHFIETVLGLEYKVIWECDWKKEIQINNHLKQFIKCQYPFKKRELTVREMTKKVTNGSLFGFVECDISVPEELREKFKDFPPIFKNIEVSKEDIGEYMCKYAEDNGYMKRPRKMLISSYKLNNGILITPLLQFYLKLGLKLTRIGQVVEYEGGYAFKDFVNSVVEARREGDKNPSSSVVAETMKLIGKCFDYGGH